MSFDNCATRNGPEKHTRKAPRLVVGLSGTPFGDKLTAHFKHLGWDVCTAGTGEEARRLALRKRAAAVVLPVAAGAGGLLATAKVLTALPKTRVVLVADRCGDDDTERLARVLGAAALVTAADGLPAVVRALIDLMPAE